MARLPITYAIALVVPLIWAAKIAGDHKILTSVPLPFFGRVTSSDPAFHVINEGAGGGGVFEINNSASVPDQIGLIGIANGAGDAIRGYQYGRGRAAWFDQPSANNLNPAVLVTTVGKDLGIRVTNKHDQPCPTPPCSSTYGGAILAETSVPDVLDATGEFVIAPGGRAVTGRNDTAGGRGIVGLARGIRGIAVTGEGREIGVIGNGLIGVSGQSQHVGVQGVSAGSFADSYGVLGQGKYGVVGRATQTGNSSGVFGESNNGFAGVEGHGSVGAHGVFARSSGTGDAVHAVTSGSTSAIYGRTTGVGFAGFFEGRVRVTGFLQKAGGGFVIDHPLDPKNQYLYHSFVESPDMMNIYNGNVILDANGESTIVLPPWFETLNRDFRYQLSSVGGPAPGLHVGQEISGNRFKIAGGPPRGKVSWQVTGVRHDRYADAHRMEVEGLKPIAERGFYLHPDLFENHDTDH